MNVPFPSLPTDNFYKFSTVLGLIVAVLSVVLPWNAHHDLMEKMIAAKQQQISSAADIEIEFGHNPNLGALFVNILRDTIGASTQTRGGHAADQLRWLHAVAHDSTLKPQEARGAVGRFLDLRAALDRVQYESERMETLERESVMGLLFGIVLMVIGLAGWYFRHQRLQDAILTTQMLKAVESTDDAPAARTPQAEDNAGPHDSRLEPSGAGV